MSRPRAAVPPQHFGLLLSAALYLGVGLTTFYAIRESDDTFPRPVAAPGSKSGESRFYLREELRAWARSLAAKREGRAA